MSSPFIAPRLGLWWVMAAGLLITLFWLATDHMHRATGTMSATLLLAGLLRLVSTPERAGGLTVRSRWLDTVMLVALAVVGAALGFTLNLSPILPNSP